MTSLLEQIKLIHSEAADALKEADFKTDTEIRSLTREDLHELLPGTQNLRMRKKIFNVLHKPTPLSELQEELRELMQHAFASSSQTDRGLLMDHIEFMKNQINIVQILLTKTNELLESVSTCSLLDTTGGHPQGAQGDSITKTSAEDCQEATVKYMTFVRSETFGADEQLMKQVNDGNCGVQFMQNSQDGQITIVFCPITSRIESDVNAVMFYVPGDKPVILVKMYHVFEPKSSLCGNMRTDDRNIVLQVTVFYHETQHGLLKCKENDSAVSEIQKELLKLSNHRSKDTSASLGWVNYFT